MMLPGGGVRHLPSPGAGSRAGHGRAAAAPPVPLDARDAAEARLRAAVEMALHQSEARMITVRTARQAAVDTPAEYRRIRAACG
jgi:hypothetical protein